MILLFLILITIKTLVIAVLTDNKTLNISGICGYPGEPMSSQHNVENKKIFDSGQTVSYQCVDILGFKQERTCLNGQWVGAQARCGYGKDNDLKRVIVKNCYNEKIIKDFDEINLQKNFDRFFNSFSTERYDEKPLRMSNSTCLRWYFYLTKNSYFQFVRTDFATVFEGVSKSSKEVPVVTAFVAQIRNSNLCQIEAMKQYKHIFTNKWISYGYKYHFYLTCHINKSTEPKNVFIVETVTKVPLTLDLVRFSVAEVYGGVSDPACGVPEVPIGVIAKPIKEYQLYEVFCDEPYYTNTTLVVRTQLVCTSNAIWSGIYPKCKPRMSCDNTFALKHNSKSQIKSIENVFYYNKTLWYAINGTVVSYHCVGQGSDHSLNIESKKCLTNGFWEKKKCNRLDHSVEGTVKPAQSSREPISESINVGSLSPVYGMAAFTSLIVITIAITSLVLIWKKRDRTEYKDPNVGNDAQNNSNGGQFKEKQCEVIGWVDRPPRTHRPVTENTYVDENQGIYRKQYAYQTEAIYDVPPNSSMAIPIVTKETELEQNLFSEEPIYDRPKHRHPTHD